VEFKEGILSAAPMAILSRVDVIVVAGAMEPIIESSCIKVSPQNGRLVLSRR